MSKTTSFTRIHQRKRGKEEAFVRIHQRKREKEEAYTTRKTLLETYLMFPPNIDQQNWLPTPNFVMPQPQQMQQEQNMMHFNLNGHHHVENQNWFLNHTLQCNQNVARIALQPPKQNDSSKWMNNKLFFFCLFVAYKILSI